MFTVMDHDYVFQNDFAGEVYMSLADVPGVDGDEVTGYEALSVVSLPLMQPPKKSKQISAVLKVIEYRIPENFCHHFYRATTFLLPVCFALHQAPSKKYRL